jgi:uncharacterized membrane protein
MSPRARNWIIALAVADAICFALTVHAHLSFHHARGGPTVMSVGQLLGWAISALLLIAIGVVLVAVHLEKRYGDHRRQRGGRPGQPPRLRR